MNPGGEPERDETGLPPVDIEIPDDARELDRDVQAYYRELRAQRRQQRGHRMRGSVAKDGIILPLLACCLILALITGTLLTVFTATSDQMQGLPGGAGGAGKATARPSASSSARPGSSASSNPASSGAASSGAASGAGTSAAASGGTQAGAPAIPDVVPGVLPKAAIAVDGQPPIPVGDLHRAALVLIPAQCNCTAAVSWLIGVVNGAHARTYLVYTDSTKTTADRLYKSLSFSLRTQTSLALAPDDVLSDSVPGTQDGRLAAILLGPAKVAYATAFRAGDNPTTLIRALTH